MTILDKTSKFGLRVKIEKISPVEFHVSMADADSGEVFRTKTACTEQVAAIHAQRFLD